MTAICLLNEMATVANIVKKVTVSVFIHNIFDVVLKEGGRNGSRSFSQP